MTTAWWAQALLVAVLAVPALGAATAALMPRRLDRPARIVAAAFAAVTFVLTVLLVVPHIRDFGSYAYTYASGRSGEWFAVGFAPRKQSLTLYVMDGFGDYEALLAHLGPHKTGKSCLHVKRLEDVDEDVLRELITRSLAHVRER